MGLTLFRSRRRSADTWTPAVPAARKSHPALASAAAAALEPLESRVLFVTYTVTDLGTLGGLSSGAHDINASGQVAVEAQLPQDSNFVTPTHAGRYSGTSLADVGTLAGGGDSHGLGINTAGVVVGDASGADGIPHAAVFSNTPGASPTDLGFLAGGSSSGARAINDNGDVAGFSSTAVSGAHAFLYTGTPKALVDLGTIGNDPLQDNQSQAFDLNNAGHVVGDSTVQNGIDTHAFFYNGTSMRDLGVLAGGSNSRGNAINNADLVVGQASTAGGTDHAFRVDASNPAATLQDLGVLSGTDTSVANGVNAAGDVVGSSFSGGDPTAGKAFIFTGGALTDLNTLLATADRGRWSLKQAFAINDAGQIVGQGLINGQFHAFRLEPSDTGPGDTNPPAAGVSADNVDVPGVATVAVTVTYTDDTAVDTGTIGPDDITVSKGGTTLQVTGFTKAPATGDAGTIVATYTVAAPNGTAFLPADRGTYTVNVAAGAVKDTSGKSVAAASGSFDVTLVSQTGPAATVGQPTGIAAGGSTGTVTVTYTDETGVAANTVDAFDLSVVGPTGPLTVITGTPSPATNAGTITATYTFVAPGGTWDAADNGNYTISVNAGQVTDADGTAADTAIGSFAVDLQDVEPVVDPTFNNGEQVQANLVAEALATDTAGRILIAGHVGSLTDGSSQAVLERLRPDGTLDPTFGAGGMVVTPGTVGGNEASYAVAVDSAGKIYTAGTQGGQFAVRRFSADGKVDTKFGTRGLAFTSVGGSNDIAYSLVLLPDGSVVVGGGSNGAFAFAKFTAKGTLDTTFAGTGFITFAVGATPTGADVVGAMALDAQGRIVAAGGSGANVAVARLTAAGAQDPTFDGGNAITVGGLVAMADETGPDRSIGLAVQSDGKILVANTTAGGNFGTVRLNADGSVDTAFASNGLATTDFGGTDDADTVLVQGTGEIYVLGTTDAGGGQTAVAAFNANGTPNTAFNGTGTFTSPVTITAGQVAGQSATSASSATPSHVLRPAALHVGSLLLRAFGGLTSDGRLVVGTPNQAPTATSTPTPLRRLNVPGSGTVGQFGTVGGKKGRKLQFLDADGTKVTLSLKGPGTGTAFFDGSSVDLVLTGTAAGTTVSVGGKGGKGRIRLRDVRTDGALKGFTAKNSDIAGTFYVNGALKGASFGGLTGTIAAAGSIGSISFAGDLSSGQVLAGTNFGSDAKAGGTGSAADAFAAASIAKFSASKTVANATIAAGVNPTNGTYRDNNDTVVGGTASRIGSISVKKSTDPSTRFEAGAFGKAKLPQKAAPITDARLLLLA